jgi:hypothetical protein
MAIHKPGFFLRAPALTQMIFSTRRSPRLLPHGTRSPSRQHRLLRRLGTLLGLVWAAPLSLAGLLIGLPILLWHGRVQLLLAAPPVLLVSGPLADDILGRHPLGSMNAMALGHVVIAENQGLSVRVLVHELTHVRQAAWWGPIFPLAYLLSSLWAVMRGQDAYWHNHFERSARCAEDRL